MKTREEIIAYASTIQGWYPELNLEYLYAIGWWAKRNAIAQKRPSVFVEVGTWHGRSAYVLSQIADLLVCVDPYTGDDHLYVHAHIAYENAKVHLRQAGCCPVVFMQAKSDVILPLLRTESAALVHIDGDHSDAAVRFDASEAQRIAISGGYVCGDDYGEVANAVNDLHPEVYSGRLWWVRMGQHVLAR